MLTLWCVELFRWRRARGNNHCPWIAAAARPARGSGAACRRIARVPKGCVFQSGTLFGRWRGWPDVRPRGRILQRDRSVRIRRKLRKRIVASAFGRTAHGGFTCAIRRWNWSSAIRSPVTELVPASTFMTAGDARQVQIGLTSLTHSSGALTPSKSRPEASTMTIPSTKASRAFVVSRSFWIMARK